MVINGLCKVVKTLSHLPCRFQNGILSPNKVRYYLRISSHIVDKNPIWSPLSLIIFCISVLFTYDFPGNLAPVWSWVLSCVLKYKNSVTLPKRKYMHWISFFQHESCPIVFNFSVGKSTIQWVRKRKTNWSVCEAALEGAKVTSTVTEMLGKRQHSWIPKTMTKFLS